ncbi:uncharacterized protein DUF930 [Rhizobium azibense]|uniref:Uncharacterized protein DUF930 n=1 Tax=Rhizobium azibense TaxID=1136135 RepID=A0A4R3QNV2_9HYPH|nr:DUF930 domain-containing protein [Rhizobium azibense]TCU21712.1 uncharacterized protein DUF930 [Rhizobium azibense]
MFSQNGSIAQRARAASGNRIVQLSTSEKLEQVHRSKTELRPDFPVAYPVADTSLSGSLILRANGGGVEASANVALPIQPEAAPDIDTTGAFEFSVGQEFPETAFRARGRRRG